MSQRKRPKECLSSIPFNPVNVNNIMARLKTQLGRSELENLVANIWETINEPSYLNDHRLINELVSMLSEEKQLRWIRRNGEIMEA